jgi:hypothetical protein
MGPNEVRRRSEWPSPPNYEEILLYKELCKENPFIHPINIYYQEIPRSPIDSRRRKYNEASRCNDTSRRCATSVGDRTARNADAIEDGTAQSVASTGDRTARQRSAEGTVLNKVNSILNKLSISNFDKLSSELLKIEILSDDLLESIVKSIFNKAIIEPHFGEIYSKLCLCFGNFNIQFKRFLLNMCQNEFEKRNRMTGNIVFIGQLFKTQMISEQIIHSCLDKLIDDPTGENIECICKLLEIAGGSMRENLDENFKKLKSISENKIIIDSRRRFMIKDLIELKQNNWVSRKTNQPLKMVTELCSV